MKPEYWDRAKRALARRDPVMGAIMRRHPGVYMMARGEPFMTLARAICGQQISVKAAQSVWNRVCICLEQKITPEAVVAAERKNLRACGLSDRKTEYIADLARHFVDGKVHARNWPQMSDEEIIAELTDVRGIGRWTAEMFLIFQLGRMDVSAATRRSSESATAMSPWRAAAMPIDVRIPGSGVGVVLSSASYSARASAHRLPSR